MRSKAPLTKTYLCAVKFWRTGPNISTLASGVRHVVRTQGFESQDIYKAERLLQRAGLIFISSGFHKTVQLTPAGERKALCRNVQLAPWTDSGYPGSKLK